MQQRLIIGRFINTASWVHHLDPRAKMTAMMIYAASVILIDTWQGLLWLAIISLAVMISTKIPLKLFMRGIKPLAPLIIFMMLFQFFFIKEGELLFSWGFIHVYDQGITRGMLAAGRMILFVTFTAILTFTTTPIKLTQGLEGILRPFTIIGVSPQKIALMISIALRFIPTILDEAQKIVKAQASRGADMKELPWKDKGKMAISLLVPVMVSAFKRAEDLLYSMESRGFQLGAPRSSYYTLTWHLQDTAFIGIMFLAMVGIICF
ncbi:energy-coupling factor transporter transmembrane protein EcfT [Paenibacillus sp. N1-5-1-14]|uniref:energy-coupling factor transporter transmembrane component T family protein n=1 Tax=Paenibacillus radicibacter TaxID=2972488 RepID=UPI0021595E61|nr:energy-coupling factor transporter transmembrane component T [Paenibacillus radicibacter]MCR8645274.1 energy-coupling factor transporter transmembrane protein EcfT [Paenibacillus radicibacter]